MSKSTPTVSVIIPCFNQKPKYLKDAVASVQEQTHPPHEILIIDDGSTDRKTLAAFEQLSAPPSVRVIRKENGGLASARNLGVENATGELIQFLDSDDFIAKNKLEIQLECFACDPTLDVCISNSRLCSQSKKNLGPIPGVKFELSSDVLRDVLFRWERDLSFPIHSALFRTGLRERGLMKFREDLKAKEDWVFWITLAQNGVRFKLLDKELAIYRQHSANMCRNVEEMTRQMVRAGFVVYDVIPEELKAEFLNHISSHISEEYVGVARVDTIQRMARNQLFDRKIIGEKCPKPGFRTGYRIFLMSLSWALEKRARGYADRLKRLVMSGLQRHA